MSSVGLRSWFCNSIRQPPVSQIVSALHCIACRAMVKSHDAALILTANNFHLKPSLPLPTTLITQPIRYADTIQIGIGSHSLGHVHVSLLSQHFNCIAIIITNIIPVELENTITGLLFVTNRHQLNSSRKSFGCISNALQFRWFAR